MAYLLILISKTQKLDFCSGEHSVILLLQHLSFLPSAIEWVVKNDACEVTEIGTNLLTSLNGDRKTSDA